MSVMLQTPSRASTASSSSFQPVSRQNTMSSHDGGRSVRQSKRYSMTTLYLSMSANEKDLEIEDDLAKGLDDCCRRSSSTSANALSSPKNPSGLEVQDIFPIQKEFRLREGCSVSRLSHCLVDPKSDGLRRGKSRTPLCLDSVLTIHSKMKLRATLKMLQIYRRVSFQTTRRLRNTATCFSSYNLSPDILHIFAA
jgi:hypothetical protein